MPTVGLLGQTVCVVLHRLHILLAASPNLDIMGNSLQPGEPDETVKRDTATNVHRLHVADFDHKRGVPVDSRFRDAAIRIENAAFRYRSGELTDAAEVANPRNRQSTKRIGHDTACLATTQPAMS